MFVQRIRQIKQEFQVNNFRGSVGALITEFGGVDEILKEYGSVDRFCNDLIVAGYDKGYVSRIRRNLKNKRGKNV